MVATEEPDLAFERRRRGALAMATEEQPPSEKEPAPSDSKTLSQADRAVLEVERRELLDRLEEDDQ